MKAIIRYASVTALLMILGWIVIPQRYDIQFPRKAGPEFDPKVRFLLRDRINTEHPDIVLLGDSTLSDGVDADRLAVLTGKKIVKFDVHGSASAFWFLLLKNNIVIAEAPPPAVVIVFHDTMMTAPGYRVHGSYFVQLDEFAKKEEPVLLEKSYLNLMNPLEKAADEYVPIYGARVQIRQAIDRRIRYTIPGWFGCDVNCTDASLYDIFTAANFEQGQLQNAIAAAEDYLFTSSQLNFKRQVDQSYIPEMIRLSKENSIPLVLVRLKSQGIGRSDAETAAIKFYMNDMAEYLQDNDVLFLDYGTDPRLKNEYYKDNLHLDPNGQQIFTQILAEGLSEIVE